jgi:hypothetical protein
MDNIGNAIIVWGQYDGSYGQIYKSEYRNGVWTNPSSLSDHISPDGQSAGDPQIAMDNNGNAIIVWEQYDSSNNYQIFKSEYRNGVWTNPANLTDNISPDGLGVGMPQVAMDNNGNAIIVWEQYDSSNNYQIFKSEYRDGAWTNPASVADHISPEGGGNADSLYPEVAMDNNGNAIIVWKQYNGINYKIFKSEYRNGVWHNPTSLSDYINPDGTSPAFDPQVAMDNNGNAVIVWSQSDGSNYQIFKSEYRNGVWTNPSSLADNISPQGQDSFNPQVAMDNNGNAIIVWYQRDESNIYQIFKSEYRKDVWTNPSSLSDHISPDGQHAWYSRVAMDGNGNAVIVWYQSDGSNYQIFKSEYRNGVWINPSSLSDNISPDGQDAFDPHVAMDNNGNAIIVWYQSDGTQWQLFKSEYR